MGASWSAQTFRQAGEIPSGPEAFLDFCFFEDPIHILYTDLKHRLSGGGRREGRVGECVECRSKRVLGVSLAFSNQQ